LDDCHRLIPRTLPIDSFNAADARVLHESPLTRITRGASCRYADGADDSLERVPKAPAG